MPSTARSRPRIRSASYHLCGRTIGTGRALLLFTTQRCGRYHGTYLNSALLFVADMHAMERAMDCAKGAQGSQAKTSNATWLHFARWRPVGAAIVATPQLGRTGVQKPKRNG